MPSPTLGIEPIWHEGKLSSLQTSHFVSSDGSEVYVANIVLDGNVIGNDNSELSGYSYIEGPTKKIPLDYFLCGASYVHDTEDSLIAWAPKWCQATAEF